MVQLYSQREAVTDWGRSRFAEGRQEGRQEGVQEGERKGRQEEKIDMAKKLYKRGMALNDIADFLEVSVDQVQTWLK